MELIIIKGDKNVGKTTTAALLHNYLVERHNAEVKWMMLDHWKFPLQEKDLIPDFRSVLMYNMYTIGIISHGDTSRYLKAFIKEMIDDYHPDILIICANKKEYIWNMLRRTFENELKEENIFEITQEHWSPCIDNTIAFKERLVRTINNHILHFCNVKISS